MQDHVGVNVNTTVENLPTTHSSHRIWEVVLTLSQSTINELKQKHPEANEADP